MMRLRENEDAISSVISVVLMIAAAIIIIVVIASLVLGVTSDIPDAKVVAVTARVSPLTEEMADLYEHLYNKPPDPTSRYLMVTLYSAVRELDNAHPPDSDHLPLTATTIGPRPPTTMTISPTAVTIPPTARPSTTMIISPTARPPTTMTISPTIIPIVTVNPITTPVGGLDLTLIVNGTRAGGAEGLNVGESFISKFPIIPGDCHAIVVAKFKDGSEQIVLNGHF